MKCPKCNKETLYTAYVRLEFPAEEGKRKRTNKAMGYMCVNPACDFSVKSKPENSGSSEKQA
ncbi:hypothetical protein [Methanosarcina mazei]|jgi:hypothetical protein|uniref:Uncharacterized protein n=1 Tax=Methanosarcina mazei TaxID=2209 RepID=A0A0F8NU73_METMZ|nr:hypothetical protein [Methanosarcina mazei]MDD4522722.1 hypothetical protein [Methanosarcina sp.]KKG03913.1 hypothetical protein DU40_14350 [Methanosarcina mazei]KKG07678.1 hypothetical protein DU31_10440 [Methanosarcina mazei]KKG33780.1 hypothetical protein DU49_09340 [Methanosarcina mazei]KKG39784.1 hypothetical protein DU41_18280 [Methanosarcina mazei]